MEQLVFPCCILAQLQKTLVAKTNMSRCSYLFQSSDRVTAENAVPACDNDDVLRNIGHLFDCKVTHSSKGLLLKQIAESHSTHRQA